MARAARPPHWTHAPLYIAVRAGAAAMNALEIDGASPVIRSIGRAWIRAPWSADRLARSRENIAACFPEWARDRVERCAVESHCHLFRLAAEVACLPRLLSEDGWPTRVRLGHMEDAIEILLERRPCLLITGHCGNWEVLGSTLGSLGFPIHALYRPLDVARIDRWVRRSRARHGLRLLSKFGASDDLPAILQRGEPVAFIADQNAGERGLFVPFFDRLASAYKTIGLLAMRHEAPIICGQARRLGGPDARRLRYEIDAVDIIRPEDWKPQPDPLYYITARYRRAIESMVRRAPEQYLWMHRAWKSRPRHEKEHQPFPEALRDKIRSLPWMTGEGVERIVERSNWDARAIAARRG